MAVPPAESALVTDRNIEYVADQGDKSSANGLLELGNKILGWCQDLFHACLLQLVQKSSGDGQTKL